MKMILFIKHLLQSIGIKHARKAIESAIRISEYRTDNLILYGIAYKETMAFKRLELAEKIQIFKSELTIAIFRLKL